MTPCLRIVAFGSIFLLRGTLPVAACAQSLQVQPSAISSAAPGFTAQARLVLTNPGTDPLRKVTLTQFSNDGITVHFPSQGAGILAAKGQLEWPLTITVPASAHLPGTVVFDAAYTSGSVVNHQYAALSVQTDATLKNLDATLDGTPDPVSEQRPGALYLILTNNMDVPAQVNVSFDVPPSALDTPAVQPFAVPPRSTVAQKIALTAPFRVTPGNHPIAVNVDAIWQRNGTQEERRFALTKSITVGIFFESELLKALSIPSILVLPGCLVLFTMQLLFSAGWMGLKDDSQLPNLTVASSGFWILAIPLSAVFVPVYYLIFHVNLLLTYGVNDLLTIWVATLPLGILIYWVIGLRNREYRRDHVFSTSDTPAIVLEKLNRNGLSLERPQVKYKFNGLELFGFVLEEIRDGQTMLWVAPPILAEWGKDALAVKGRYNEVINRTRKTADLLQVLNESPSSVTLEFQKTGVIPNPYHIKIDSITGFPGPAVLTLTEARPGGV